MVKLWFSSSCSCARMHRKARAISPKLATSSGLAQELRFAEFERQSKTEKMGSSVCRNLKTGRICPPWKMSVSHNILAIFWLQYRSADCQMEKGNLRRVVQVVSGNKFTGKKYIDNLILSGGTTLEGCAICTSSSLQFCLRYLQTIFRKARWLLYSSS